MACSAHPVIRFAVLLLGIVAGGASSGDDQPAPPVAASQPDVSAVTGPRRRIAEVGPEIFYLEDDGGRLVPVPGFSYRDFVELFRMQAGLPGVLQPPAAVLERLRVRLDLRAAAAQGGRTCPVVVECAVRQTRGGWVHLPIDLQGLLLSGTARHEGGGRVVIDSDPARGGYRIWFDDAPTKGRDATHVVTLEGSAAIDTTTATQTVMLRLPTAVTSLVELASDRTTPAVSVQPAPPPQRIATSATADGSLTTITGLAGDVRIRIADANTAPPAWNGVPEAAVESLVRIDGRHAVTEATIRLTSLPPGLRGVKVSLPPRTLLRSVRAPATIVAQGGTEAAPTVDVAIDPDRNGAAAIDLQCERPLDPAATAPFEAAGFAVEQIEAWRQWGRVSLVVEGEWRAEWTPGPGVRRVDPPPAARRPGFVAAFAYDVQPASLPVRVKPRQSRVVIEPDYRYTVGAARLDLLARFRVNASGGPATSFAVALDPTWTLDEVGPAGVVDIGGVATAPGSVTIPFSQPLFGDAVIELRASRLIDRGTSRLSWKLPVPKANLVAPAAVVVDADADIEILPDVAGSTGLVRQSTAAVPHTGSDTSALVYRLDLPQGTFAASRRFLERRVTATVSARIEIDDADIGVAQAVRLDVEHVPLQYVELWVPEGVADSGTLEVRQGDKLLDPFQVAEPAAEPPVSGSMAVRMRAILSEPLLGSGDLQISYRLATEAVPAESTLAVDVPLVLPAGGRISRQVAVVRASDAVSVAVRGDAWRPGSSVADMPRAWTTNKPQELLPLAIAARERSTAAGVVVEAAWLQTRLLADRREDVATYVIGGSGAATNVVLPVAEGTATASATAWIDGGAVPTTDRRDGTVVIEVPPAADGQPRILELRRSSPRDAPASGWARAVGLPALVDLAAPMFPSGIEQRRFYWEITARPDEHLLGAPAAWTSQQRWQWTGPSLERLPVVSREMLAGWIQASGRGARPHGIAAPVTEPAGVERRLVYSGVGSPGTARIWVVPSWCLVLVASGAALGAGLAIAYRPWLRRTSVILPVLAACMLAAAAAPEPAALLFQAALPGIGLSLVAWLLRGWLDRPPAADPHPTPAALSHSSMTRSLGAAAASGSAVSLVVAGSSLRREDSLTAITKQIP